MGKERYKVKCLTKINCDENGRVDEDKCLFKEVEAKSINEALTVADEQSITGDGLIIHERYNGKDWEIINEGYTRAFQILAGIDPGYGKKFPDVNELLDFVNTRIKDGVDEKVIIRMALQKYDTNEDLIKSHIKIVKNDNIESYKSEVLTKNWIEKEGTWEAESVNFYYKIVTDNEGIWLTITDKESGKDFKNSWSHEYGKLESVKKYAVYYRTREYIKNIIN